MGLSDIVRDVMNGRDLAATIERLRADRRAAIDHLLSVLDGSTKYELAKDVDLRDAHDNLHSALAALGADDVEYLIALLRDALTTENHQPAYSLTWVLAHLDDRAAVDV